jgi:hypothetical protein
MTTKKKVEIKSLPRYPDSTGRFADRVLVANGERIGGTYYCCADYIRPGRRWASYGPGGFSKGHRTRALAEAVQIKAYHSKVHKRSRKTGKLLPFKTTEGYSR